MPEDKPVVNDTAIELLLAEDDHDEQIMRDPREDAERPADSLDSIILANLVTPY
jgi:hypothetical protein